MKKLRKIFAFMLAFAMTLALSITAFAAEDKGNITIKNATEGKIYTIYKIFDANPSGGDELVAYTATEAQKTFFEGQEGNPFKFTKNIEGTYNVTKEDGITDEAVIAFLQQFYTEKTDAAAQETTYELNAGFAAIITYSDYQTANAATVTFEDIPYGYYLVTSTLGAVITVDSTNKDATIIDKNQAGPEWNDDSKQIVEGENFTSTNSANYGDTINFQIKFKATNYAGEKEIESYEIKDIMAAGLELLDDPSMVVKVGEDTLTENDYTIEKSETDNSFTLKINWMEEGAFKYSSPVDITVTYSAKVLDEALIAGEGNKNSATLTYYTVNPEDPDNPEPHEDSETSETTTYVYALAINKTDGKGAALEGATFNLKDSNDNDIYVVPTTTDGVYNYSSDPTATNATKDIVSPENGVIIVKGVEAGTYTLTEIKAPAGYNVLEGTVDIAASIAETSSYKTTYTVYYDEDGNVTNTETQTTSTVNTDVPVSLLTVVNKAGAELPSTGGMGTTIFYVIGGILVVGAGILLVVKRRMRGQL